jgi:cobalt-zinc-cadmium efflux system outer membrane protein
VSASRERVRVLGARVLSACNLLLGFPVLTAAQDALDVNRYVEIVLRSHPAVRQSGALEEAARAEQKAARLLPDPELGFSRDRARLIGESDSRGSETAFSVTQSIPWPGTFTAGVRVGDRAADVLRSAAETARWEIEIEARRAFARLVSSRALLAIARAGEEDARSLRDLVTRRTELGESRESDRIKATVEWLRQQRRVRSAEREAEAAESVVRTLAVEPLPRPLVMRSELPPPLPRPDLESLKARLAARNPLLRAALWEAERQSALLSVALQARAPNFDVSFFRERELDREANGLSLGLRVPLWNANRGEIARARAGVATATAAAERTRLGLMAELEVRFKDLELAADQLAMLESEVLPSAASGLSLARFSYEEGETSLLDLLDAQGTYRETQREAVEARVALALAVAELQRLVGPDFDPWR